MTVITRDDSELISLVFVLNKALNSSGGNTSVKFTDIKDDSYVEIVLDSLSLSMCGFIATTTFDTTLLNAGVYKSTFLVEGVVYATEHISFEENKIEVTTPIDGVLILD